MATEKKKMATPKLDRVTLAVVFYLIEKLDGVLGKTHLQKMLFLSDLIFTKKYNGPLTKLQFEKYHYGPFSVEVNDYVDSLKKRNFISSKEMFFNDDSGKTYTRFYKKKGGSVKSFLLKEIGADKLVSLDEVIDSFGNASLQQVLDVVYSLQMVKDSELKKPLDMAEVIKKETEDQPDELDLF